MDLEEAKLKLKITEDERFAVGNYTSAFHSTMNGLIGFNMRNYIESNNRGWHLIGVDSQEKKTDAEIGEEVLSYFEKSALIYSAMLKNSHKQKAPYSLVRGTSVKEAEALREGIAVDRILSTTTDEDVAKGRFTDPKGPAVLRISVAEDVPFIDINEFMKDEDRNGFEREKEYILAPFAKVTGARLLSNWDGYKFYSVGLAKPEMRPFADGEKGTLGSDIKSNFAEMIRKGKQFIYVSDKWEILNERMKRTTNQEERSDIREEQAKLMNEYSALSKEIRAFEEKMHNYAQGLFAEREKEITEAIELVEQDEARIRAEKLEETKKQIREQRTTAIKEGIPRLSEIDKVPSSYVSTYESLKAEEKTYADMARTLGIQFDLQLPTQDIDSLLRYIAKNIQDIKTRVEDIKGKNFEDDDELGEAASKISSYNIKAECVRRHGSKAYEITQEYRDEALFDTKKGIDGRVQEIIKSTKLQLIAMKRSEIEGRRISFWGRLRGLDKLQEAELRNLNLEEEIVKKTVTVEKPDYSVHDSLAELRAFSRRELDGLATEEMIQFNNVVRRYFGVDDSEIERRADTKLRTSMPTVIEPKKRRMSTAKKIERANARTQSLQVELLDTKNAPRPQNNNSFVSRKSNAINRFVKVLNQVEATLLPESSIRGMELRIVYESRKR